ncbi:MAG: ABC transporter ATP-binding protein [Lachnospiraceae bacterium]|nr:ABC transporter ATP-binding protein [Lachnospiraceae bacterium]
MKISVEKIKKAYRNNLFSKKTILEDISFEAKEGECVGIVGTNGCGKTTLLSILSGINTADEGSFKVTLDKEIDVLQHPKIISEVIGYVPQGNPLLEELSVKDNLKLWYCQSSLNVEEELKDGVLKMLGIDEFINMKVSKISGGMKKRLSIGCAVANEPKILILDEPGASLDVVCREKIDKYLVHFKENGGIIIITTHEAREIGICDRVLVMKKGMLSEYNYEGVEKLAKDLEN